MPSPGARRRRRPDIRDRLPRVPDTSEVRLDARQKEQRRLRGFRCGGSFREEPRSESRLQPSDSAADTDEGAERRVLGPPHSGSPAHEVSKHLGASRSICAVSQTVISKNLAYARRRCDPILPLRERGDPAGAHREDQAAKGLKSSNFTTRQGAFILANAWDAGSGAPPCFFRVRAIASTSAGFAFSIGEPDRFPGRDSVLETLPISSSDVTPRQR